MFAVRMWGYARLLAERLGCGFCGGMCPTGGSLSERKELAMVWRNGELIEGPLRSA